jgi:lipopolysaccharide transport system ATP-binding protein
MDTVLKVQDLSKMYRLGQIGAGSLREEVNQLWSKLRKSGKNNKSDNERYNSESNEFWALRDVHFELERGDVLGVIGRNGAGKSTLLKLISRITEPTRGSIAYKGRIASLLEVGTGFHPELSGRDNIFLNGAILGMRRSEIRSKLDAIVEFAGVGPHLNTPVKRYSSGMYVRLAFSIAAHLDPDILIVDEVLAVGDANFQKKCVGKLQDVSSSGRTVLFVSHNLGLVKSFCNKGLLLHNGQRNFFGSCSEAVERYVALAQNTQKIKRERNKNSEIRLTHVSIKSDDGSAIIQSGQGFELEFELENNSRHPETTNVYFELYNSSGVLISAFRSGSKGAADTHTEDGHKYTCRIESNGLRPGDYYIDVTVRHQEREVDHVESAATLQVEDGYLQDRLINKGNQPGAVQILHTWNKPTYTA